MEDFIDKGVNLKTTFYTLTAACFDLIWLLFALNTDPVWKVQATLNAVAMSPILIAGLVKLFNIMTVSLPSYLYMCQWSLLGPYVFNWIGFVYAMTNSTGLLTSKSNVIAVAVFFLIEQFQLFLQVQVLEGIYEIHESRIAL